MLNKSHRPTRDVTNLRIDRATIGEMLLPIIPIMRGLCH